MALADLLDRASFTKALELQSVVVPKREVAALCAQLRRHGALFDMPRLRSVVEDEGDPESRLVLLHESAGSDLAGLTEAARELLAARGAEPRLYTLRLGYEYWPAEHVLRALLPAGTEVPSSFETVGHVAHVNLRDEQLPFKLLIGRVLLDKNETRIRTVLNKVGTIDSEFRVPEFEVIAGESSLETEVREHGSIFRLNYGEVYWNSRLEHEHKRLSDSFKPGEVVCDMMAGIGPFAIPAARRRVAVHANDLNPRCADYLRLNAALNKVEARLRVYNLDARAFVRALAGAAVPGVSIAACCFDHIVMNLPASAVEFLDALAGAFTGEQWARRSLPLIHCYAFLRDNETEDALRKRVETALGGGVEEEWRVVPVRDVAPHKTMVCVVFRAPSWLRNELASRREDEERDERCSKRSKEQQGFSRFKGAVF